MRTDTILTLALFALVAFVAGPALAGDPGSDSVSRYEGDSMAGGREYLGATSSRVGVSYSENYYGNLLQRGEVAARAAAWASDAGRYGRIITRISNDSFSHGYSINRHFTMLRASLAYFIGPVPVTLTGNASFSFGVSVAATSSSNPRVFSLSVMGSAGLGGSASAGIGIPGWSAGLRGYVNLVSLASQLWMSYDQLMMVTYGLDAQASGRISLQTLVGTLVGYVDYLFGLSSFEKVICTIGPAWSHSVDLWR